MNLKLQFELILKYVLSYLDGLQIIMTFHKINMKMISQINVYVNQSASIDLIELKKKLPSNWKKVKSE